MDNIIEIRELRKSFGDVKAVDGISFSVRKGELFAFLGVNGAGKSTTISILVGTLKKDSGECYVEGRPIEEIDKLLPDIGIVFQSSVLDSRISARDNLLYRAMLYGMSRKEFEEGLSQFAKRLQLSDFLKRPVGKLSGGQRRKVDIVRALLHHPKILILDEPTTGLDPMTRKMVWEFVEELREREGLTVILTTHYMEEASQADHVVIIDHGKIVASGTPLELKKEYAGDYLRIYRCEESLQGYLKEEGIPFRKDNGTLTILFEETKAAKKFLVENEKRIEDFEIVKGTMDDVFLAVTGKELERR